MSDIITRETHKDEFEYLDGLRASAVTNMYAAGSWLQGAFMLDRGEARIILKAWMKDLR